MKNLLQSYIAIDIRICAKVIPLAVEWIKLEQQTVCVYRFIGYLGSIVRLAKVFSVIIITCNSYN